MSSRIRSLETTFFSLSATMTGAQGYASLITALGAAIKRQVFCVRVSLNKETNRLLPRQTRGRERQRSSLLLHWAEDEWSNSSGLSKSKVIQLIYCKWKLLVDNRSAFQETQQTKSFAVKYPKLIAASMVWAMACSIVSPRLLDCWPWPRIPGACPSHWKLPLQSHWNRLTPPVNLPRHFSSQRLIACSSSHVNFFQITVLKYLAQSFQRPVRVPSWQTAGTRESSVALCTDGMTRNTKSSFHRVCMIDSWTRNEENSCDPLTSATDVKRDLTSLDLATDGRIRIWNENRFIFTLLLLLLCDLLFDASWRSSPRGVSVRWCSGYHVCFTRRRPRVRASLEPDPFLFRHCPDLRTNVQMGFLFTPTAMSGQVK